jgi:hypothetical protein
MVKNPQERAEREEVPAPVDYFIVGATEHRWWPVSTPMARHVLRQLDRLVSPRWIRFVDLSGATVQIRPGEIVDVTQCSAEQRAWRRWFDRTLREEYENGEWR